jgi:hypothetical protein
MRARTLVACWQQIMCGCILLISVTGLPAAEYSRLPESTTHEQALALRLQKLQGLLAQASPYQRYILLDTAARTAFELNQLDLASAYARELIILAPRFPEDWNYAPAVHYANIILGRVALLKDDIETAKTCLLAASRVPYSEILDHRGADLQLANALLARGQRETVAIYLQACTGFWPRNRVQLDRWLQQLNKGKIPSLLSPEQIQ